MCLVGGAVALRRRIAVLPRPLPVSGGQALLCGAQQLLQRGYSGLRGGHSSGCRPRVMWPSSRWGCGLSSGQMLLDLSTSLLTWTS